MGTPVQDYGRNRRKSPRRNFVYPARILFGKGVPPGTCEIVDISETGAQLEVNAATEMPDEFSLLIGGHVEVQRKCWVVWRSGTRIGVQFQGKSPRPPRP